VSPVRALLAVHLRTTWKRSQLDLGGKGVVALWLVAVFLVIFVVLPGLLLSLNTGVYLGTRFRDPAAVHILGGVLTMLLVAGGVVGRSRVLDWESTRIYPLRLRSLFTAELVAGCADLLPIIIAFITAALLLGVGIAEPRSLPFLLIPWLLTVGGVVLLRQVLGGLAARFVRHLRAGLVAVALLLGIAGAILPEWTSLDPSLLGQVLEALPLTQSMQGVSDALSGRWPLATARQVYPLLVLLLLLASAVWTLSRPVEPEAARASIDGTTARLWSFSSATHGIARLHWISVRSSSVGLLGFFVPLLAFYLLHGALAAKAGGLLLLVPATMFWVGVMNAQTQFNQFGLDGAGVATLLVLPVSAVELLLGKAIGLAAYQGLQMLLLLGLIGFMAALEPAVALSALCLSGCQLLLSVGTGHWTSAQMPRPLPRNPFASGAKSSPGPLLVLTSLGLTILGSGVFGGAFFLAARYAPGYLLAIMASLLAFMALLYWRLLLPIGARHLDGRREMLVQFLGG
jgi:hypothetical protein